MAKYIRDIEWLLDAPIVNLTESAVEKSIKTNADFQYDAGLRPRVIRRSSGYCCEWCASLEGEYEYPDVPDEVWMRHRNCTCIVEYYPGDGRKQNVHTKQWANIGREKRIAFSKIEIPKSLGAAGRRYDVRLPDGRNAKLASGTSIIKVVPIAGKGTTNNIKVAKYLEKEFGIPAKKWVKYRGEGIIRDEGKNIRAEVHWFEAEGNRVKMKVKKWL